MFDWLKSLLEKIFPPAAPSKKLTPKAAIPPPPAQNQAFALSQQASNYLDTVWLNNQNKIVTLPAGTLVWHGGLIGPNNPVTNQKGLWATKDPQKKAYYNGWAKNDAQGKGITAHLTEYETSKDLPLADFDGHSMTFFTETLCNSQHDLMKKSIIAWVTAKPSLRGIVAINSGVDEVVFAYPANDLNVITQTPL